MPSHARSLARKIIKGDPSWTKHQKLQLLVSSRSLRSLLRSSLACLRTWKQITTATTTGKAFGQLVHDSFTVGDYPVTDARDLEILRVNIYDFAVFENTPKSDYHWVFVIQKGSLKRGGDKIFFRDTHGKSQMIDINKMNDVEIDVAPVLESDDMSNYLKIHALG